LESAKISYLPTESSLKELAETMEKQPPAAILIAAGKNDHPLAETLSEVKRSSRALPVIVYGDSTDEALIVDDTGYASLPINRCSRLMTAGHGGQVVVSGDRDAHAGSAACRYGTHRSG